MPSEFGVCNHPSTLAKNDCFERAVFFVLFASHIFSTNPEKKHERSVRMLLFFFQDDLMTGL